MNKSSYLVEHNRLMSDLTVALQSDLARLSVDANGGRSILFVYPPIDEEAYIAEAKKKFSNCVFIDLRQLLVEFIDSCGMEELINNYWEFGTEIFSSSNFDETFHTYIMNTIRTAFAGGKIPVITHTGVIYGMGFSNIHIMEQEDVMHSSIPLVVFYPATIDNNKIMFLDKQVASHYRCVVIK